MRRRHKYNARKTEIDGYRFDSLREARRYGELKLIQRGGNIGGIDVHPKYVIEHQGVKICNVVLDFKYRKIDSHGIRSADIVEDVKGVDTPVSRLKRKLLKAFYGIEVKVIK